MPKLCPNITFPHQQDFFPIRSVTKSSTARFSHENLVEKFKIFVQDFVPIRTALREHFENRSANQNKATAMALYFLDWVRTQNQRQNRTRDAHKTSPQGTTTKRQP